MIPARQGKETREKERGVIMALDYAKCAKEIFELLGGRDNLVSAAHCATRLRLVTVDNSKIDVKKLEEVDGVKGVFESNGQLQLIIGTGTVNKVYEEFLAVSGMTAATKDDVKAAAAAQQPVWKRMLKTVGDVFVPILPAIVASGLMMGLVEALGKIPALNFASTPWYGFLDMAANTAFAFLPVIVAVSAARVFGCNIFLGAVMGLMMVHTGLLNAWNAGSADAINSFFGVTDGVIPTWNLFGNMKIGNYTVGSIQRVGYQGHVIPVIISIFLMAKIEKWLHQHVPEMIDLFVTPLCTVLSTALLTFIVIGPVFSKLETLVLGGAQQLITVGFGIGALIMGAIYPITVVMGLHHMYNVIEAGMLSSAEFNNLNIWMPIASAANFAQFGACLAVGLKCKRNKTKQVAIPSALSASLGITEPAIFGVNMRFFKPFVCGMIGGAIAAMFGSWVGLGAKAYGVTGIPGYLTINKPLTYTILLAIAGGIAFALTWIIWKEEEPEETKAAEAPEEAPAAAPVEAAEAAVEKKLYSPMKGNAMPVSEIPDPVFASGALGDGVGIEPTIGRVYAPCDGEIATIPDSKHAIGIMGPDGMELLIHVGIDTVKMEGKGFEPLVAVGDKVTKGQRILDFSIDEIKKAGYSTVTAVLCTNSFDYPEYKVVKTGPVDFGDLIVDAEEAAPAGPEKKLYAPIKGNAIVVADIPDPVFASGALGDGVGIEPAVGEVYAPCDGEIATVTETKHAIGLMGPDGMELLIHVGIDTVKMEGRGFNPLVAVGDKVTKGQKLMDFSIDQILKEGYSTTTAVLCTNSYDFPDYKVVKTGEVEVGDLIVDAE